MPWLAGGWLITPDELDAWALARKPEMLVINKPGGGVCQRSRSPR